MLLLSSLHRMAPSKYRNSIHKNIVGKQNPLSARKQIERIFNILWRTFVGVGIGGKRGLEEQTHVLRTFNIMLQPYIDNSCIEIANIYNQFP